jgi:hypothetical protein
VRPSPSVSGPRTLTSSSFPSSLAASPSSQVSLSALEQSAPVLHTAYRPPTLLHLLSLPSPAPSSLSSPRPNNASLRRSRRTSTHRCIQETVQGSFRRRSPSRTTQRRSESRTRRLPPPLPSLPDLTVGGRLPRSSSERIVPAVVPIATSDPGWTRVPVRRPSGAIEICDEEGGGFRGLGRALPAV